MAEYGDIRTGRHRVFVLHTHVVFVTKFRRPVVTGAHLDRMEQIMRDVCADFACELPEVNGEANHVHLLVNLPPKVAISRLVNSLSLPRYAEKSAAPRPEGQSTADESGSRESAVHRGRKPTAPLNGGRVNGTQLTVAVVRDPTRKRMRHTTTSVRRRRDRASTAPRWFCSIRCQACSGSTSAISTNTCGSGTCPR